MSTVKQFVEKKVNEMDRTIRKLIREKNRLETQIQTLEVERSDWIDLRMKIRGDDETEG